ncbi:M24 family metallopeptidase [Salipiger abyssi]|uniref:Xaa-Pro aminopeptidase n=1 Tax=Salipiger abyssi TaxID=1250539 RepID=A0A1P8UQ74_9RHOB|nr:Xaa-Pro peptidase family protein [Salipiger abyssi]APZ51498.1 Xaa-Pro aminopeptidase [Salipiger abyssi]
MAMIFPEAEYRARLAAIQSGMARAGRDALLLTTEPEIRYISGFLTRFWESSTRPWFLIVPVRGDPVAVIPGIGQPLMAQGWIADIRCWPSPDYADDGVSLLASALAEFVPTGGAIGVPSGGETHLRMPLESWAALRAALPLRSFGDDAGILRRLRMVKSADEIACIEHACAIAGRAFARVPEIARAGVPLSHVFRRFQMLCLEEGADWVPYLAGAAAPGGYADVISPATDAPLRQGDVLMLDTGLVRDGYFCDFDRNFSIGPASPALREAHAALIAATQAGFAAARPGARVCDLYHAMAAVTGGGVESGRLGHGLGMQLTEPPSLIPADDTVLAPGMVLTLEPLISMGQGRILVHEENIVITEQCARWLSPVAGPEIMEIAA